MEVIISKQLQARLENLIQDELNENSMFIDVDDPATKITYVFKTSKVSIKVVNGDSKYFTYFNYCEI